MKLLIITQKLDKNDPVLGFFHRWVEEFAKNFGSITVICLEKGESFLPESIRVLSLGKEKKKSKILYLLNFYKYIWEERKNYDAVFVHMNQEYVLLAGDILRFMGKRIYLWRNHAKGSLFTNMAVILAHKVFCTSSQSYTARFRKTKLMPVGIDTEFFKPNMGATRNAGSVLFLGRISPVKRVLEFIDWVQTKGYTATIAGPILSQDKAYGEEVLKSLTPNIKYIGPVSEEKARALYQTHEIYANFTPGGSMDKTILEAAACGSKVVVKNPDLKILEEMNEGELRNYVVENHSLKKLMEELKKEIQL